MDRPSASEGERRGAELIAERLRALGCKVEIEEERAHGGYWWPIGLVNAAVATAGVVTLRKRTVWTRAIAAGLAGAGAAALWDDLGHGRRWFRRAVLPHRSTWNVVAEVGDPDGRADVRPDRTSRRRPLRADLPPDPAADPDEARAALARARRAELPAPVRGLGRASAGQRRGGRSESGGFSAPARRSPRARPRRWPTSGLRAVVPGANDNLSSVGVLVAMAERLREQPDRGSAGAADLDRLGGIVQRRDAGLRPSATSAISIASGPRWCASSASAVRRWSSSRARACSACATTRSTCARRSRRPRRTPASRSCAGCGRRPRPTRSSGCAPATRWRRSRQSTRPSSR